MHSTAEQVEAQVTAHSSGGNGSAPADAVPPEHATPRPFSTPVGSLPELCRLVTDTSLADANVDVARFAGHRGAGPVAATGGYLECGSRADASAPEDVFPRLRWGGQFLFASRSEGETGELARRYAAHGFVLEQPPTFVRHGWWRLPLLSRKAHYFLARKVSLVAPGQTTDRFTHSVQLVPNFKPDVADPWVVLKSIPSEDYLVARFRKKFPDAPDALLRKRARKFTERIFPTFLTRETAFLLILQDHLPSPYNKKVPRIVDVEKDERGFVRSFKMTWLRNGGPKLPQMEFAHQAADLLRAMHDIARVIHLDLRMDNMVITEQGVGFIDFGSASRVGEDLSRNPLLASLFGELMQTSQIQRLLDQMTIAGHVTSEAIRQGRGKVDRSVDFFYLALVFNSPHSNPDLAALVDYDPQSQDAADLRKLTAQILRPADPQNPAFRSAKDILHGIERIRLGLETFPRA